MKKDKVQEMNEGQVAQESAETVASNTVNSDAETAQTEDLRAYVPAGAATAFAVPQEEDSYHEEVHGEDVEDLFDANEEEQEEDNSEEEADSGSIADAFREQGEQDFIEETVKRINSLYRKNVDNGKIEIGTYLLDEVFKGDVEKAMSTNPSKHTTFAKIAEREDLLVEPKTLGSWVRAAAVMRDLKKRVSNLPSLTTYHYVELATVKDKKQRTQFAKDAELNGWSVKALREEIRKAKGKDKSDADKLKDDMDKSLRQFTELTAEQDLADFASDVASVKDAYPPEKAMKLLPGVKKCLANVRASEQLLKEFHGSLRSIVEEAMEPLSD
ncbi:MAG: hypothetical protein V1792_09670 [Pseudomonadota bacterium]